MRAAVHATAEVPLMPLGHERVPETLCIQNVLATAHQTAGATLGRAADRSPIKMHHLERALSTGPEWHAHPYNRRSTLHSVAVVVHVAGTGGSHSARPSAATAAILRHLNAHSAPPDILAVAATHGVLRITLVLEGLRAGRRWKGMMRD